MNNQPTVNILVVDDDLKTLSAMEALLSRPGRNIVTASSGADALRHLLRDDFALILLDVRLPVMDGFETAALIRENERFRYTPIMFLSAIDTLDSDVFRGVASGAVDYLFKPVVPEILQAKVSVFVDLFRMNEQLKQQAVRQSEERFRLVVESLQDYAVFMMDTGGRVSTWNRGVERIGGWKQEEVIGQFFERFYIPEDQESGRPAIALKTASAEGHYEEEGWRSRKDGSRFWANVVVTALRDDDSELVGFSAILRDLTERKRVEEELKRLNAELERRFAEKAAELFKTTRERERLQEQLLQAQKMESLGTLAGGIAHDINNLLNIISGYTSLILQNAAEHVRVEKSVEVINEMVGRGSNLVQQLLAMARRTPTKFVQVQLDNVFERLRVLLEETFPKQIEIEWNIDPEMIPVTGDPNQLHQVMLNICLNARDAMPNGGKLRISTGTVFGSALRQIFQEATEEQYSTITVEDSGIGMDEATKSRIFEPFFTTKPQGQGSGLGLAVAYGIISNHKGFIDVEAEPQRGTTFRIYLPAGKSKAELPRGDERAEQLRSVPGNGETVLFVEDEKQQLQLMQIFLQKNGYRVLPAADGVEAVEIYRRAKDDIAVVLLDIGLPKLNGWEAFCKIKEINPNVRAIFATGFMADHVESQLASGELYGVILKPYQLDEVLEKISGAIRKVTAGESREGSPIYPAAPNKNPS